jgi:hypothetical protein
MDRSEMSMRLAEGMSIPKMRGIRLSLALFVALVFADDTHDAFPPNDPAVFAHFFD